MAEILRLDRTAPPPPKDRPLKRNIVRLDYLDGWCIKSPVRCDCGREYANVFRHSGRWQIYGALHCAGCHIDLHTIESVGELQHYIRLHRASGRPAWGTAKMRGWL